MVTILGHKCVHLPCGSLAEICAWCAPKCVLGRMQQILKKGLVAKSFFVYSLWTKYGKN